MANQKMVVCTNREPLTLTRQPTFLILPDPPYRCAINGIDEAPESFQFTIMHLPTKLNLPMEDFIGVPHQIRQLASLLREVLYNSGQRSAREEVPHQRSSQNCTFDPSPISYIINRDKECHSLLIFFHKLTPYGPKKELEHQPPQSQPYFTSIT